MLVKLLWGELWLFNIVTVAHKKPKWGKNERKAFLNFKRNFPTSPATRPIYVSIDPPSNDVKTLSEIPVYRC